MGCFTLLFVAIITVSKATPFPCSDQHPPDSASGDDVPGTQQVTTLQYCFIDNCTIVRIDTREKLDIVYTADSFLIATPTDGHTSVIIAKYQHEIPCLVPHNIIASQTVILRVVALLCSTLLIVINGIVLVIHLMFKHLRTTFGKLLMIHSLGIVCLSIATCVKVITETWTQLLVCHFATISLLIFNAIASTSASCMLHFLAYILYRSNKLQRITKVSL